MSNKTFKKFIISLCTIPAIAITAIAGVDYDAGMNAYNKGDLDFAKILFEKAMKVNYYDVNARYMYSQILVQEKKYTEAKQQYKKIIELSPNSQAAQYSKQGIEKIDTYLDKQALANKTKTNTSKSQKTDNQSNSTATDYVKNAYRGGQKYIRERGMARIYIEPNATYNPMMKKAYSEWQSALGSNVMFTYAGNKDDATDIISFAGGDTSGNGNVQEGGNCSYNIQGNTLKGSKITINLTGAGGKKLTDAMIYHTMLHEIGHSIGILGHSPYSGDIMSQGAKTPLAHLSQRDKNTAQLLYKNYGKQPDKQDIQKAKEEELTGIAKKMPTHPSGYIDMGDELFAAGQYRQALEWYKKVETMQPSEMVYLREVKAYEMLKDNDNAAVYYKKILEVSPGSKTALNNLLAIYQSEVRYRDGKNLLDTFLENNPTMKNDKDIQNYSRIFSEENVKAIEARKALFNNVN